MQHIISASRRTDIPAFFSGRLFDDLRAGFCDVPHPFNPARTTRVSLKVTDVAAMVFWSKNPAPLLHRLDELDSFGIPYYFSFSLNAYPALLEPNLPPIEERIETFLALSARTSRNRVVWRYDPIIISSVTTVEWHREQFAGLLNRLAGATDTVVVSILDMYRKTARKLADLKESGITAEQAGSETPGLRELLSEIAEAATARGLAIESCAEEKWLTECGIAPGHCIDARRITQVLGVPAAHVKDRGQRELCGCTKSVDIGTNGTCRHGCVYCYAATSRNAGLNCSTA